MRDPESDREVREHSAGSAPQDPATAAFEALREEVALTRRAVAGLAAERASITIPDHSETLAQILQMTIATARRLKALGEVPALKLSAMDWGREIADAGEAARRGDHAALSQARSAFEGAARELKASVRSARTADRQRTWLAVTGIAGMVVGMLLWAFAIGPLSAHLPLLQQSPERRAADILGLSQEKAGERLIQTAAPKLWQDLVLGDRIVVANRDKLKRCQSRARRRQDACVITLPPKWR